MQGNHILIILLVIIIIWALIERKLIGITRYEISSERLPANGNKLRFILLADLHNSTFGKQNERLVRQIEELGPDYILVAGDMINKKEAVYPGNAYDLLEKLAKKYMIYYAYGNHEQRMEQYGDKDFLNSATKNGKPAYSSLDTEKLYTTWVEFKDKLEALGVIFLDNESVSVEQAGYRFCLTGISISHSYFERYNTPEMEEEYLKALINADKIDDYHILIAHNPFYFQSYVKWGADLVVSGHFHGGMVRLPGVGGMISPQAKFFPKYDGGLYEENDKYMIVSRGLGSHSIMPRLFNVPELVSIEIRGKE